jgi:Family of unknown function (DUF6166)
MKLTIEGHISSTIISVNGKPLSPRASPAVWNHSPDGFNWGYGGSGPARLALAILLEAGLRREEALRLHQDFKWDFVARWPSADFHVEVDLQQWLDHKCLTRDPGAEALIFSLALHLSPV